MKIKLSNRADRDFNEAADYIIAENPTAAQMFADQIDQVCKILCSNPEIGKPAGRRDWRVFTMRNFRYRIFYRIDADTIIIECIFHTSQNPEKI